MDRSTPPARDEAELLLAEAGAARVARHIARERQKQELRRERDRLMLDLERDLGLTGVAERFGIGSPAMTKLLEGARERLNGARTEGRSGGLEISAGRLRPREGRWADADAHFEALGRTLSAR